MGVYITLQDGLLSVRDDSTFSGCYDLSAEAYIFFRSLGLGD